MTPRPAPASAPPRRLTITLLGFSSGLPLALTASTLTVRLAESGVNKATIGLFAGVSLAYAFKFLGAPFVDALKLPVLTRLLGRRRSWMAVTQTALIAALLVLAQAPAAAPSFIGLCAVAVAVLSALQDIAIDAWRVERLTPEEQGMGGTYAVLGYRLGMLASSVGALHLASVADWRLTYSAMAALMGVGLGTTLCCREPAVPEAGEALRQRGRMGEWLEQSVIGPLQEFFSRPGGWALPLLLIFSYKLSDAFIGIMTNPFYLETGFTKVQIADIAKLYGIVTTILAGFAGGWMVRRCGVFLPLALGSMVCALSNLIFIPLSHAGPDTWMMAAIVLLDSIGGGIGGIALVAYISNLCNRRYTATQYALLSSLAASARALVGMPAGWAAVQLGWQGFFALSALMGLPGLLLIALLWRKRPVPASA